ncbi:MAG: DedA family protein [Candidatus Methylomirabilales bacterium]
MGEGFFTFFTEHAYPILFLGLMLDTAGLPIPGELLLLAGGYLASAGRLDLAAVILLGTSGAVVGDHVGYLVGRLGGRRLLMFYCRATLGSGRCVEKTEAYFQRFGALTIALARFVMGVRLFASPLAGATVIPYRRFLVYDLLGALLWSAAFVLLGYTLSPGGVRIGKQFAQAKQLLFLLALVGVAGTVAFRLWRRARYGSALLKAAQEPTAE